MNTNNPPERVIRIIADMIMGGRLLVCPASMFSAERYNGAFHGVAISLMARTEISPIILGYYSPSQNGVVVSLKGIALCISGGAVV